MGLCKIHVYHDNIKYNKLNALFADRRVKDAKFSQTCFRTQSYVKQKHGRNIHG